VKVLFENIVSGHLFGQDAIKKAKNQNKAEIDHILDEKKLGIIEPRYRGGDHKNHDDSHHDREVGE
jgi:hypothetical protein